MSNSYRISGDDGNVLELGSSMAAVNILKNQ